MNRPLSSLCALTLLLGVATGCAGPTNVDTTETETSVEGAGRQGSPDPGNGEASPAPSPGAKGAEGVEGTEEAGDTEGESAGAPEGSGSGSGAGGRLGFSRVFDEVGDTETSGSTPAWPDITQVRLRDRGNALQVTVQLVGPIPPEMPDDGTIATLDVRLRDPRDRETYLSASADDRGWRNRAGQDGQAARARGFNVSARTVEWTMTWRALGNPDRLDWSAHLGWTRTTLTNVAYVFDSAPDMGTERFRRR